MKKITIQNIKEGMVLASPVFDNNKQLIFRTGNKLTFNDISWLSSIGVKELIIESNEQISSGDINPQNILIKKVMKEYQAEDLDTLRNKVKEKLLEKFRPINSHLRQEFFLQCLNAVNKRYGI